MAEQIERLLRPREVAQILQLSQMQIYRLARKGELPSVQVGKSVRFKPSLIANFIKENSKNEINDPN
jgi:excisionase family DNA binding protein